MIENLEEIYSQNIHDYELKLLFEDFRDYCDEEGLVRDSSYKLLFVPTGFSYEWNKKHKLYFCPVSWHKQEFTYFGLYKSKSIRTISKVENIIIADFDINNQKLITHSKNYTDRQIERLRNGLIDFGKSQSGLKYYILPEDEFYEIDFKKESKGGIQGFRYKDLRKYVDESKLKSINDNSETLSKLLKDKVWT